MLALSLSEIQISLYSTTFYDAVGTGVVNLSIYDHPRYREYAELMIDEGIAHRLELDENPVEVAQKVKDDFEVENREFYFAPFNKEFDNF